MVLEGQFGGARGSLSFGGARGSLVFVALEGQFCGYHASRLVSECQRSLLANLALVYWDWVR